MTTLIAALEAECRKLANDEFDLVLEIEAIERGSHCFDEGLDDMRCHSERLCSVRDDLERALEQCRYIAGLEDMGPSV